MGNLTSAWISAASLPFSVGISLFWFPTNYMLSNRYQNVSAAEFIAGEAVFDSASSGVVHG